MTGGHHNGSRYAFRTAEHQHPAVIRVDHHLQRTEFFDDDVMELLRPNQLIESDGEHCTDQENGQVCYDACDGNQEIIPSVILEIPGIDGHRFRPAEAQQEHKNRTQRIQMACRIQGETPHHLRRWITAAQRHIAMCALMQDQAEQDGKYIIAHVDDEADRIRAQLLCVHFEPV